MPLVVVVEDDPASQKTVARLLRAGGFDAAIYSSAEDFLASPPQGVPVGLLLDLHLGGMSGLDLETSTRIGAPITTVLLNNGDMATYPGGYPVAREKFDVTHMTGDYAKIAEGLGAEGITVTEPGQIAPALARARKLNDEGKSVLIDVHSNMEARRSRFDQGGGG